MMFDSEFIAMYNCSDIADYGVVTIMTNARDRVTRFASDSIEGVDKCATHVGQQHVLRARGCDPLDHGIHWSVYKCWVSAWSCRLTAKARREDVNMANFAKRIGEKGDDVCLVRDAGDKFCRDGVHVNPKDYGAGYCYLSLITGRARHRVARILGGYPFVWDVLRFVAFAGDWSEQGFAVAFFGDDVYHIQQVPWTLETSLLAVIERLVHVPSHARIGGEVGGVSLTGRGLSFDRAAVHHGLYAVQLCDVDECYAVGIDSANERGRAIRNWLNDRGVFQDAEFANELVSAVMLCTIGGSDFSCVSNQRLQSLVKMWQLYGDLQCKIHAHMIVLAAGGIAAEYSDMCVRYQNNRVMADAFMASKLYTYCLKGDLRDGSKGYADMLEGVIGAMALMCGEAVSRALIDEFGLVDKNFISRCAHIAPRVAPRVELTIDQWKRVAELKRSGLL